jgi:hypothetical protein
MVELDSYSSGDRSDSGVDRDKAQALRSNTPKARAPSRLAVGFIINMTRATW